MFCMNEDILYKRPVYFLNFYHGGIMKKSLVVLMILISSMVFAQQKRINNKRFANQQGRNFQNLSFEERFKLRTQRKYSNIKKNLNKKDAQKVIAVLKKYDQKIFDLRKPHFEKVQKLRQSEFADFKKEKQLIKESLNIRAEIIKLKKQEFQELKSLGLKDEILIRILRREMRNHKRPFNKRRMKGMRRTGNGRGLYKNGFQNP